MVEEPLPPQQLLELRQLRLGACPLDVVGLDGQGSQFADLFPYQLGVAGQRDGLEQLLQSLAVLVLHFIELVHARHVRWCGAREILGLREAALQSFGPIREAAPDGPCAGRQAPLVEGHQESHGSGPPIVAGCGRAGALALHESRHLPVQVELGTVDLEVDGTRNALREDRPGHPLAVLVPLRELDHRLLGAPQVERRPARIHRLPDRTHVGVRVAIEELQKQREVLGVALVRRCGQQQDVVGRIPQQLSELVALALVRLVRRRHPMGLVDDNQVPVHLAEARQDVVPFCEV